MTKHAVYILSGRSFGPVFIASTSELEKRLAQHRSGKVSQSQFRIDRLVYTERYDCALKAASRVTALKSASREWLEALVRSQNPALLDLYAPARSDMAA